MACDPSAFEYDELGRPSNYAQGSTAAVRLRAFYANQGFITEEDGVAEWIKEL